MSGEKLLNRNVTYCHPRQCGKSYLSFIEAAEKVREVSEKNKQWLNTVPDVLLFMRCTYKRLREHVADLDLTGEPAKLTVPLLFGGFRIEVFDNKFEMFQRAVELFNTGIKFAIVIEEERTASGEGE